jgi:hypothetical protein
MNAPAQSQSAKESSPRPFGGVSGNDRSARLVLPRLKQSEFSI